MPDASTQSRAAASLETFLGQWRRRSQLQTALEALVPALLLAAAFLGGVAGLTWLGAGTNLPHLPPIVLLGAVGLGVVLGVLRAIWVADFSRQKIARQIDRILPQAADRWCSWVELPMAGAPSDPFAHLRALDLQQFLTNLPPHQRLRPPWRWPRGGITALLALSASLTLWQLALAHHATLATARAEALTLLRTKQAALAREQQIFAEMQDRREMPQSPSAQAIGTLPESPRASSADTTISQDIARAQVHLAQAIQELESGPSWPAGFSVRDPDEQARLALASAAAEFVSSPSETSFPPDAPLQPEESWPPRVRALPTTDEFLTTRPLNRSSDFLPSAASAPDGPGAAPASSDPAQLREQLLAGLRPESGRPPEAGALPQDPGGAGGRLAPTNTEGHLRSAAATDEPSEGVVRTPWSEEFQPSASGGSLPLARENRPQELPPGRGEFRLPRRLTPAGAEIRAVLSAAEKFPAAASGGVSPDPGEGVREALAAALAGPEMQELPSDLPPRTRPTVERYFERLRQAGTLPPIE